jgi:hypothetical protein
MPSDTDVSPIPGPSPEIASPVVTETQAQTSSFWPGLLLAVIAIASIGAWLSIHEWYGLLENRANNHFSFEKIPGGFDSSILRQTLAMFLVISAAYATAIILLQFVSRLSILGRLGLLALVAIPAAINVMLYPVGALDVFNYMIEIKLAFHYDENPYIATFANYRPDSYAGPAFLTDVKLFYGPAWLIFTAIPALISGFDDFIHTLIALKIFNALLIAATAVVIGWHHRRSPLMWLAVAMFAANPLVLFEGIANGHNDVLITVFLVGAVVALQHRSPLAGPLLALATLVKLYSGALLPIFIVVALKEHWGWKRIATTVALTAVTVVAVCAPYWGEGELVNGLISGLEESQEMDHVSPLSLARQYAQNEEAHARADTEFALSRPSFEIVPQEIQDNISRRFTIAFVVGMLALAAAVWRGRPVPLAAAETLLLLFLCMTNLYGWYLIPVIALLALHPDRLSRIYVVIASTLGLAYYPMFIYGHYNSGWTRFRIHQFLALFLTAPIVLYLAARLVTWRLPLATGSHAREDDPGTTRSLTSAQPTPQS